MTPAEEKELRDEVFGMLKAGRWTKMTMALRSWLNRTCPEYRRDEIEPKLSWVGTLFVHREQHAARTLLPPTDPRCITPAYAEDAMRHLIAEWIGTTMATYARFVDRVAKHPPAEADIALVVRRMKDQNPDAVYEDA